MSGLRRYRIWVEGGVQRVGYRNFAARRARSLGIRGYVRNLPDGRVEAVAEGSEEAIEAFLNALRRGPRRARVDRIVRVPEAVGEELVGFTIRG